MLPVVRGDEATAWNILAYAASLLPLTLLLFIVGGLGYVYLAVAIILGALFIAYAFRLLRSGAAGRRAVARAVYLYSLLFLALLFVAIMVGSTLRLFSSHSRLRSPPPCTRAARRGGGAGGRSGAS